MTKLEKAIVGAAAAMVIAVAAVRYGSMFVADQPPQTRAKAMSLGVSLGGGDFQVRIQNADPTYYVGCRATIDGAYQAPAFDLGVRMVPEWIVRELGRTAEAAYRRGEISTDAYRRTLNQALDDSRRRLLLVSRKPEARVHLSDFTKGDRRYPWQERRPRQVEIVCSRYREVPRDALSPAEVWWDRLQLPAASRPAEVWFDHLTTPDEVIQTFFDPANQDLRWPWGQGSARWTGAP